MFAPISTVPLPPAHPAQVLVSPDPVPPTQLTQVPVSPDPDPDTLRQVQELLHRSEFPSLFNEAVRRFQALPPKRLQPLKPRTSRNDRLRNRSSEQLAKRRTQRLQCKSYVHTSARAEAGSRRIRSTREVTALAKRGNAFSLPRVD
jgi:hypothetical protein